jgi:arylsulfate sulfotransferase
MYSLDCDSKQLGTGLRGPVLLTLLILLAAAWTPVQAQMTVSLSPSVPSPAPLGVPVTWTASVSGANPGTLVYRFRVLHLGRGSHTLVDYGPKSSLTWTTIDEEGAYPMEVSVQNINTGDAASTTATFVFSPLTEGADAAVAPSANPLVFIYSAPACRAGRVRVQFQSAGGIVDSTPSQLCLPGHRRNFYLAGMVPNTSCTAQYIVETGTATVTGPPLTFRPPASTVQPPKVSLLTTGQPPAVDGVMLQSLLSGVAIATDLSGNILWTGPSDLSYVTRPQTGGTFLGLYENDAEDSSQQFFRQFDLAGITIAETNAAQVSRQLALLGVHPINAFHHEARKLPNGNYMVLAEYDMILTNVQGPGPVDVIGDVILVLDSNLQVLWSWDSFQHLDTSRQAPLGETCAAGNAGCSPWYLLPVANDWLHGNALQLTPDGNILYSMRNQDWVIKIDYENGAGSGSVIWRLGVGGDFQIIPDESSDVYPWFSHQHDSNFESDNVSMLVFDDGNTRVGNPAYPTANQDSRGQMLMVDQQNLVATLVLNADVGSYSSAVGSAQLLPNGDYHFDSGFIYINSTGALVSQSVEVNASGDIVYGIGFATLEYRTFRMSDLYTAP